MTPADLRLLLATLLTGAAGKTEAYWLKQIGPVKTLPIATNIHSNWSVSPIATGDDLAAIVKAVDLVRGEHPYVDDPRPSPR